MLSGIDLEKGCRTIFYTIVGIIVAIIVVIALVVIAVGLLIGHILGWTAFWIYWAIIAIFALYLWWSNRETPTAETTLPESNE